MVWTTMIYTVVMLLGIIIVWEYLRGRAFSEGFTDGVTPEYFAKYFPRRGDVGPGTLQETDGWIRNPRYFEGYVDVQALGYAADFCRVIMRPDNPESMMLACALAGQEGLDSFTYRTDSARSGMRFSRDDYMRDVDGDKRTDYGRILKIALAPNDAWESRVVRAGLTRFKQTEEITDHTPPTDIAELLYFYEGIMVWYRLYDDILDYAENTQIGLAGGLKIDETPHLPKTEGLAFNRTPPGSADIKPADDQFIKIGENPRLEFDSVVELRQLRGISVWAYFDEFTNNARIFDFGNGAGKDNVLLGIKGRGNSTAAFGTLMGTPKPTDPICRTRPAEEVSPQFFMLSSEANVDAFSCPGPEPIDSLLPEEDIAVAEPKADLLFEIWDTEQRKMNLLVRGVIPRRKWVHICLTTTDTASFRPTWVIYVDGQQVMKQEDGFTALANYTTKNYIGRSNWEGVSSQYEDADERFRGSLFDFRLYRKPLSEKKVLQTIQWGRKKLGLPVSRL